MECHYCNKTFSAKSSLFHHQKTAKFCIQKQGLQANQDYKCTYCSKILSTQLRLNTHIKICKIRLKEEEDKDTAELERCKLDVKDKNELIVQLKEREKQKDEYIKELKDMLEKANRAITEIAMQPKTTNTNTNNDNRTSHITNNFDINDIAKLTRVLDMHLTKDVLRRGQEGLAEMLKEHLLQTATGEPIYECTDVARQKFEFRNADGNIETDPKATKLIRNLGRSGMWGKAHSTAKKLWEKEDGTVNTDAQHFHMPNVTEVLEIDKDSTKLRRRLASITARQKPSKK